MTIAVYIVSSRDQIENFSLKTREREFSGSKVYVGVAQDGLRSVAFADGPPLGLKRIVEDRGDCHKELKQLRERVVAMLRAMHIGCDMLHVFIHFGGQGENDLKKFNASLKGATSGDEQFKCYAISFGNKMPEDLFPDAKFNPPCGKHFRSMCQKLQVGNVEDFEHLRALRVLLSVAHENKEGEYVVVSDKISLEDVFGGNPQWMLTGAEKDWLGARRELLRIFDMDDQEDRWRIPGVLLAKDYNSLKEGLLMKGVVA